MGKSLDFILEHYQATLTDIGTELGAMVHQALADGDFKRAGVLCEAIDRVTNILQTKVKELDDVPGV